MEPYEVNGYEVMQGGGIVYCCQSKEEADATAAAGNKFYNENQRDHETWEELVHFMGWDKTPPSWF